MKKVALREIPEEKGFAYYSMWVSCSNCNFGGKVAILKGNQVNNVRCPNCECSTLHISEGL